MLDQNDNLPQADGQDKNELEKQTSNSNLEDVISNIENSNAEQSETNETKSIPLKEYETLSFDDLADELDHLITEESITAIKVHVEEIKKAFYNKYNHFIDEKREDYKHDNNGSDEGFEYHFPIKNRFDALYNKYRDKKNTQYNALQNQLKDNLKKREEILVELKELLDNSSENQQTLTKKINEIKDRWKNAGSIPKDKYNHVWNNYQFHMERFYEHMNLDRGMRDLEFKNNYEQKRKIIDRVKELITETDVIKSFKELQILHRIWKEEIGPVSKDKREELWQEFSELTKKLHDKREDFNNVIRNNELVNLSKRKAIISNIKSIISEPITSHNGWQSQINRVETLREAFINAGRIPAEFTDTIWGEFKQTVRDFNANKNNFYKDIKREQQNNLNKKLALVEKAKEYMNSEDFQSTTVIMKKIQEDWKTIGHVPRKFSDSVWADFKNACNHYFARLTKHINERDSAENEIYDKKKNYLESLKEFKLVGDHKKDLDAIKQHIENWKQIGKVSQNKRHIEIKFNKILDSYFDQLSLTKKDTELEKFNSKIDQIISNSDSKLLTNELIFVQRRIEELQNEIFQLENNIQFFTNAKNDNPLIKEISKNIEKHKDELEIWKEKQNILRKIEL